MLSKEIKDYIIALIAATNRCTERAIQKLAINSLTDTNSPKNILLNQGYIAALKHILFVFGEEKC